MKTKLMCPSFEGNRTTWPIKINGKTVAEILYHQWDNRYRGKMLGGETSKEYATIDEAQYWIENNLESKK